MSLSNMPAEPLSSPVTRPGLNRSRFSRRYLAALIPPPLALALAVMALAWLLAWGRGPLIIDVGADDRLDLLYLSSPQGGFFQAESRPPNPEFPQADNTYRWAGRSAQLKLPWPLDAVPLKVIVNAAAPRPGLPPDQTGAVLKVRGKLEWTDQDLGKVEVNGMYQGNLYQFRLPPHLRPNLASYELWFEADNAYRPGPGDVRSLAVLFFNLRLEPDYAAFGFSGWLATLARPLLFALMVFCCWGIGRVLLPRGQGERWALGLEALAGLLLLSSLIFWPLAAEPLYAAWAFLLPLAWLLLTLAALFSRRAAGLPAPFVYAATLLPLLPLAQFAFGRLDLYSLNPSSVQVSALVGALFYAGAIYINAGPAGPAAFERAFVRAMLTGSLITFLYDHFNVFQTNLYRGADFKVYYGALLRFEAGGPLYDLGEIANLPGAAARMPPPFSLTMWPLVRIFGSDTNAALFVWRVASELLLVACLLVLLRVFGGRRESVRYTPAVLFLFFNFGQMAESLGYGQWNMVVLLGLALLALWVKEGRPGLAGAALSVPVGLKLYPLVSVLFFVLERGRVRWRGLLGFALGGAVLALLSGLAVGFDGLWFYVSRVVLGVNRPEVDISNQSLWGFWSRLALPEVVADYKGQLPGWVTPLSYACALLMTALTGLVLWRCRRSDNDSRQLKLGALAWLAVLIPPFVWLHYIVPCLVGVLALLPALGRTAPRWQLALFGLAYAALAYGGRNDFFFTEAAGLARLASSYRFLAALALWGLSLWLLWRLPGEINRDRQDKQDLRTI